MQEGQVTVWGETFEVPKPFIVLATMNPIEFEGVYPLPEAQLDRFMSRVPIGYPSRDEMIAIMDRLREIEAFKVDRVAAPEDFVGARERLWDIHMDHNIKLYITSIVEATRKHPMVRLGASPRGAIAIMLLSRALAMIEGLDYVTPDHVKEAAYTALPHRIVLTPEARIQGVSKDEVVADVLENVRPP